MAAKVARMLARPDTRGLPGGISSASSANIAATRESFRHERGVHSRRPGRGSSARQRRCRSRWRCRAGSEGDEQECGDQAGIARHGSSGQGIREEGSPLVALLN